MEQVLLAVGLVVVAVVVAVIIERRRSPTPTSPKKYQIPLHLDRAELPGSDRPWLVAVFTSDTCDTCRGVMEAVRPLASDQVEVAEFTWQAEKARHERYGVEAVPATIVVDRTGNARATFLGPVEAMELWKQVTELVEIDPDGTGTVAPPE